ncbi:hypothetical protein F2Q70_00018912 [Brassica cretica]|uniref:HSF-type DNA-binding domain-containing protein n=1 Tax=Brassica cretica TaxID=69181 RepID=A0A8S9I3V4_BRACR|nr:hypothetical protein F2Q70_00018912 [Brassica cretica]
MAEKVSARGSSSSSPKVIPMARKVKEYYRYPAMEAFHKGCVRRYFADVLYEMVDDPSTDSIVSWSQDGSSFIFWNQDKFCSDVLPKFGLSTSPTFFVRLTNIYVEVSEHCEYAHDYFVRGKPELTVEIERQFKESGAPIKLAINTACDHWLTSDKEFTYLVTKKTLAHKGELLPHTNISSAIGSYGYIVWPDGQKPINKSLNLHGCLPDSPIVSTISPVAVPVWSKPPALALKCNIGATWSATSPVSGADLLALSWASAAVIDLKLKNIMFEFSSVKAADALNNPLEHPSSYHLCHEVLNNVYSLPKSGLCLVSDNCNVAASAIADSVTKDRRLQSYVAFGGPHCHWLSAVLLQEAT